MFATIKSLGLFGLNAFPVDVEVDIQKGLPHFDIVGLPDAAVKITVCVKAGRIGQRAMLPHRSPWKRRKKVSISLFPTSSPI